MAIPTFLLCSVVLATVFASVSSSPVHPVVPALTSGQNNSYFWFQTEDGRYVKAFLEGGPRQDPKANEENIRFYLSTLSNPNPTEEIVIDDDAKLSASHYVAGAPLKILIHGFGSGLDHGLNVLHIAAYFGHGYNYNVISVDWEKLAAAPWYNIAAEGVEVVGDKVARLVQYLVSKGLVTLDKVHIAGHSLGAHAAGFVGAKLGSGKVGRITAMDPALPLFGVKPDEERLDPSDAAFVDVIHTSGGSLLEGGLAFEDPRGHVDFYPNNGKHQPGCGIDAFGSCSHGRSHDYPAEAIGNPNAFLACKCDSWDDFKNGKCACTETAHMGEHVSLSARGNFYLYTNGDSPYSQS